MSNLGSLVKYFQQKLGNYDKQSCDQSVEQRILQDMDQTAPGQEKKESTFLIDVDLVRGSVFSKSKTRHRWIQVVCWGVLRTAFAPLYWDYWREHTSFRMAAYIMFHFMVQFLQAVCFLLIDPETSKSTQDDVFVPCMLAVFLGILHAHITAAHGLISAPGQKPRDKDPSRMSISGTVPMPTAFSRVDSMTSERPSVNLSDRETEPQSMASAKFGDGCGFNKLRVDEASSIHSTEPRASSIEWTGTRHRHTTPTQQEGLSSDADEEEAADELEDRCGPSGLVESGMSDRPTATGWSGRSVVRMRAATRSKASVLRFKTTTHRQDDSGHTSGEDEEDDGSANRRFMEYDARMSQEQFQQESKRDHSQSLDERSSTVSNHTRSFQWEYSASATSLTSRVPGHTADADDNNEMELRRRRFDRFAASSYQPPLSISQLHVSTKPASQIAQCDSSVKSTVDPLSVSVPDHLHPELYPYPGDMAVPAVDSTGELPSLAINAHLPVSEDGYANLEDTVFQPPPPISTETIKEAIISLSELGPQSPLNQKLCSLLWDPNQKTSTDPANHAVEVNSTAATTLPASTPITPVCAKEQPTPARPFRFRSWSIGLPVDSTIAPAANLSPSLLPFCYGSSLGLSSTMLSLLSDTEQQRYCLWGLGSLSPVLYAARHLSSSSSAAAANAKPQALTWDSAGRREFSSIQVLPALNAQEVSNSGGGQPLRARDRSFESDLSLAQSTSSTGSQPDQTNDRTGLHRDLESVHEIGAELCANPKSSWNGKSLELEPVKSDLLVADPKINLELYKPVRSLNTNQNSGGFLPEVAVTVTDTTRTAPEDKSTAATVFPQKTTEQLQQQQQQQNGGKEEDDELDDDDEQLINSINSYSELHETSDPLSVTCAVNEDTITTRARQRANFLQLFLRRAHTYRHQTRAQAAAHLSSDALDRYASRSHRSNQVASTTTAAMPSSKTVLPPFEAGLRKDEHIRVEPTSRRRIPSGLRNSSLAAASQSSSTKFHGNVQFDFLPSGLLYKRGAYNQPERKLSSVTRGQTASETEYDRINSDVGSDVDSSSGPEEVAIQTPGGQTQWTPVDRLASTIREPRSEPRSHQLSCSTNPAIHRLYPSAGHNHPRPKQQIPPSVISLNTTSTGGGGGGKRVTHAGAYFRDASNASWALGHDASAIPGLQSPPSEWLQGSENKLDDQRIGRSNRSRSNAVDLVTGASAPVGREAATAVVFDVGPLQKQDAEETLREKYAYPHQARDSSQNPWPQLSAGANDTIACYVWDGDRPAKCNLTMLDVGWNVIRAVERQGMSSDYILIACVSSIILPLLSVFYHWNRLQPNGAGTASLIQNVTKIATSSVLLSTSAPLGEQFPGSSPQVTPPNVSDLTPWLGSHLTDSLIAMHLQVLLRLGTKVFTLFGQPFRWLYLAFIQSDPGEQQATLGAVLWHFLSGRWLHQWLTSPDLPGRLVILLGVVLRFNVYSTIFLLLCIAERTFQQRLLYAKYFFSLTSGRRARKYRVPQFRLNKLRHIKCWLTLRSYLKKRGPQRSVENIIVASFYVVFVFGLALGSQFISRKSEHTFSQLINLDMMGLTLGIAVFQHRFLILGTKITKKYRNLSIIITEQINLYLSMEKKPLKKEDFLSTFQVLRLVEGLLKEVDGPFRICGWTVNPLVYNVFKLVLLSCFSTILSDAIGFKLKLHKLKLNAANW